MPYGAGINQAPIGAPIAGGTPGSILFVGAGGVLAQDNANLFWDDANNRIGIRTNAPAQALDVVGNAQISATLFGLGLLDISAAGAGQIKFPAVQNPSADPNTLDDLEKGTWTLVDASGGGLAITSNGAFYTKTGNAVTVSGVATYPVTADGVNNAALGGLPFTVANANGRQTGNLGFTTTANTNKALSNINTTTFNFYTTAGVAVKNSGLSAATIAWDSTYLI
jgi:hypothetical protein